MTTPHEPPDEPDDSSTGPTDQDALWRSIVDNYGDRPEIEEPEVVVPPSPKALDPDDDLPGHADGSTVVDDAGDHYVPPPPPPIPRTTPVRTLAWIGLFGVPLFVLVCLVTGVRLPSWLGLVLMGWFVGGFVFLVASMRPEERDGYDDGAVL